jgi:hypothetical protein
MSSNLDFDKDVHIDHDALEIEWLRQSELFAKYARELANAEREVKRFDERVKVIRSELILEANKDPEKCLGEGIKPTDPKIEAFYRTHERYLKAKESRIEAEYNRDMIKVAVDASNYHRKPALENLVTLHGQNYFAGPTVPHNVGALFAERVTEQSLDRARDKAVEHQKSRRRRSE